jgi:hypothetical protein
MAAENSIPPSLVQAFWSAIEAYAGWKSASGPEPKIRLASQFYSIGSIADFVTGYDDPLPDRIYGQLSGVATPVQMDGKTYAAAGRCLRGLYDDLVRLRASQE